MAIEWNHKAINSMVSTWTNGHAQRVDGIVQSRVDGGFSTEITPATPDEMLASIVAGPEGLVREYGNKDTQPDPWGIVSLMEAAGG